MLKSDKRLKTSPSRAVPARHRRIVHGTGQMQVQRARHAILFGAATLFAHSRRPDAVDGRSARTDLVHGLNLGLLTQVTF